MAYSDYGAFAYRNDIRDREREDITLREIVDNGDPDVEIGKVTSDAFDDTFDRLEYGIIGEDGVYVSLHRYGFYATQIVHVTHDEDGRLAIDDAISPSRIRQALIDSGEYRPDEHAREVYGDMSCLLDCETAWSISVDFHGWHVTLDNNGCDSIHENGYPDHCSMSKGDIRWDCYFGSAYGAGLSDYRPSDRHRFDTLDDEHKPSRLNYINVSVHDDVVAEKRRYVRLSRIIGDGLAMRMATFETDDEYGDCVDCVFNDDENSQSEYLSRYVDPFDALKLINLGIEIGKCGYDGIEVDDMGRIFPTDGTRSTVSKKEMRKILGIDKMSDLDMIVVSNWTHGTDDNHPNE